jgi:hypothetical protein
MSAATNSKPTITRRKKPARSIQVDRQLTDNLQTVGKNNLQAEEVAKLQASIPFGFLFLNRR